MHDLFMCPAPLEHISEDGPQARIGVILLC